ncbi:MAG TPA: Calx-beta domain-containing protein, partial [Thermoleophilia bacterium]|nr:Calx-beta domain-containing protein [Thermoleophilia bacterium]
VRSGKASAACTVQYATSDGTAVAGTDYTTESNTLTFGPNVLSRTFTVPIVKHTLAVPVETVNLTLSNPSAGCLVGPRGTAVLDINDDEPVVQFSTTAYTASEAAGSATITVVRSGSPAPFSVQYTTADGTATAGSDYTAPTGTLSFGTGVMSKTFTVPITNDTVHEANETVQLALVGVSGARIGARDTAVLTITDNDAGGTLAFSAPVYTIGENGGTATLTVTRTGGTASAVTVDYASADGTATAGVNYTTVSGTLVFDAGVAAQTISVPIIYDSVDGAPSKTALLTLSNPTGGAVLGAQKTATLVILDVP